MDILQDTLHNLHGLLPPRNSIPPPLLHALGLLRTSSYRLIALLYTLSQTQPSLFSLVLLCVTLYVSLKLLGFLIRSVFGWVWFVARMAFYAFAVWAVWRCVDEGGVPKGWLRFSLDRGVAEGERMWRDWEDGRGGRGW
ncbi:MAG: hypothetical protein M1833_007171 [Piccolia ochrophora]|nr:MAG: hypothetical protein M1833_007171 [Piccolia ochrophora]